MTTLNLVDAEADTEARSALWGAVCEAAAQLATRCTVYSTRSPTLTGLIRIGQPIPEVKMWQLVEALSLLTILLRADAVESEEILNVFGKTGPLALREDDLGRYLWAQHRFQGEQSALGGRPDLVVTSSSAPPSAANVLRIVEAKCRKQLDTQAVRAEFGKAYDLRVATYFIWTFYSPSVRVVEGARRLGLDMIELGFDTPRRQDLVTQPRALVSYVAHTLEQSRRAGHFVAALREAGQDAQQKLLGPVRSR
jgi:hypothetical protein